MTRILRVFPRRTQATPRDDMAHIGGPGLFDRAEDCDEVHISVTFTWDLRRAERLFDAWRQIHPRVRIGGPAFDDPGETFTAGQYLGEGHTITSRGCPRRCWFCFVPRREGPLRELPIEPGWKVHDNNLLACSRSHIENVFAMLKTQPHRPLFLGGFEAARLEPWHVDALTELKPERVYFAYDGPEKLEPLRRAGKMLREAGINNPRCYVLIGYPKDTQTAADSRCREAIDAGFMPFAMLYRDLDGKFDWDWRRFQRDWLTPAVVGARMKQHKEQRARAAKGQ